MRHVLRGYLITMATIYLLDLLRQIADAIDTLE